MTSAKKFMWALLAGGFLFFAAVGVIAYWIVWG